MSTVRGVPRRKDEELVVEFIGLPGSGKSTISRRIAEILECEELEVDESTYRLAHGLPRALRILRKGIYALDSITTDTGETLRSLRWIAGTRQTSVRDYLRNSFNWVFLMGFLRRVHRRKRVVLLDQGTFQALWSVYSTALNTLEPQHVPVFQRSALPDMAVVLRVNEATITSRLTLRPGVASRMERNIQPGGSIPGYAGPLLALTKEVLEQYAEAGLLQTIEVDNDSPAELERSAQYIAGLIQHARDSRQQLALSQKM